MVSKSKTISELYEEVKDFDLVITNDAPLATALNKMVDYPRLGYLSMTPRQIASRFALLYSDRIFEKYEIVLDITQKTGKPLKLIHQIVYKIFDVWNHCGKLENSELYLSKDEKEILNILKHYDCIETGMDNFNEDFYGDKRIAVIGKELFTLLDEEVLPKRGEPPVEIDILKDEEFKIDKTYLFNSSKDLIQNTISLINKEFENEIAIVLNPDSEYLEIIKSRLNELGIKIQVRKYLIEEVTARSVLSLMELSMRCDDLQVKELEGVTGLLDFEIDSKFNQYNFKNYAYNVSEDKKLREVYTFLRNIEGSTFEDFFKQVESKFEIIILPELKSTIEKIFSTKDVIKEQNLITLNYFIKNFDVELESEKEGVLFVNALNSAFIDRQIIFYLGIDQSWTKIFSDKEYIDKKEEDEKALKKFQVLLSQGEQRFYFAQSISYDKELLPCYYFNVLADKEIENFSDDFFNSTVVESVSDEKSYKVNRDKLSLSEQKELKTISPSSLNTFFECPKKYSFKKLVPGEDTFNFRRGTLLHNFAEFYFNHPNYVKENSEKIIDIMIGKMSNIVRDLDKDSERSIFEIGVNTLINFLEPLLNKRTKLKAPKQASDNELMKELDKPLLYSNTEQWFSNDKTQLIGKIDLQYEDTIADYKSSFNRKSESQIITRSNLNYIEENESEDFDFQMVSYISAVKEKRAGGGVNFIYNFLLSDFKSQLDSFQKIEKNLSCIEYLPITFYEYISSSECFNKLREGKSASLLEKIGYDNYKKSIIEMDLSSSEFFNKDEVRERVRQIVVDKFGLVKEDFNKRKENTFLKDIVFSFADSLHNIRIGKNEEAYIFKDDVDSFLTMVKEKVAKINEYLKDDFPTEPVFESRDVCKKCEFLNICIGNKLWK